MRADAQSGVFSVFSRAVSAAARPAVRDCSMCRGAVSSGCFKGCGVGSKRGRGASGYVAVIHDDCELATAGYAHSRMARGRCISDIVAVSSRNAIPPAARGQDVLVNTRRPQLSAGSDLPQYRVFVQFVTGRRIHLGCANDNDKVHQTPYISTRKSRTVSTSPQVCTPESWCGENGKCRHLATT